MIKQYIKQLLTALLVVVLSTALFQTAYAVDYNGDGSDTSGGSGIDGSNVVYGWSDNYVGYRIYVVSEDFGYLSPVIDIWFGTGTYDNVRNIVNESKANGATKSVYNKVTRASRNEAGGTPMPAETLLNPDGGNEIPRPWSGFSSNAQQLRNWIYTTAEGEEACNGLRLIEALFGTEPLEYYRNNDTELYIVLEGITMFDVLNEFNVRVGTYAGTAHFWGQVCRSLGQPYGNVWLRRGTNGTFAVSLYLDEYWGGNDSWGFMEMPTRISVGSDANVAEDFISADELWSMGYDTHEYTFSSLLNLTTHTWDYPLGDTPGPAPQVEDIKKDRVDIVKIYHTVDRKTGETVSWDGSFIRKENPRTIVIEDEETYVVEEWKTVKTKVTSPPSTWDPVDPIYPVQNGTSSGTVTMDPMPPENERTLFVLLVKYVDVEDEADLVLHESEISRYYQMSGTREFSSIDKKITWTAPSLGLGSVCGHGPLHDNHDGIVNGQVVHRGCNHYCGETDVSFTDNNLNLKVKNQYESSFRHILATVGAFTPKVIPESGVQYTRSYKGQVVISKNWDYRFVIWRGEDELTLSDYNFTDSDVSWQTSPINTLVTRVSNTPESTRWTARETDVPLTILLKQDDSGDYTTRGQFSCGHGSSVESIATPDREITANAPVKVYTYSGQPSGSVSSSSPKTISSMSGTTKGNGQGIEGDTVISFYPYIRMTYEQMGSTTKHDVNVLSQHKRSLTVNEYFEAGYKKASDINLNITSQQWSVHQLATNPSAGNSWAGRNKVLPGGALYSVDSDGLSGASIVLRTWQFVSEGENRQRLAEAGTSFGSDPHTVASATQAHQEFVNSSIEAFNNGYFIEQSVNSDPNASNVFSGNYSTVQRGGFGLNGALSDEDKYYMNNDSGSVGDVQSALVQAGSASTSTVFYRVYSDTSGNLYLATGSSYGGVTGATGTRILRKDQSASNLTGTAKELDSRTQVISNFISAIERNTGDDETASWASEDGKWYNEAFELVIMVQTSQFGVGLQNPARRETVLDPALCPSNSGQSDLFSSAYSSAYRLGGYSINFPDKGSGYAGTFKGEDINISGIQDMYKSKVFVIPNVNVQDLD